MATPSHKPFGQLVLFLICIVLAAIVLLFTMRAVTPIKERRDQARGTTTVTTSTIPTSATGIAPIKPDGKSGVPTSTELVVLTPVRTRPVGAICDEQNFICINTPLADGLVDNPTVVTGTAIAFENTVSWRLEDADGNAIAQSVVTTDAPDTGKPGSFQMSIFWTILPRTTTGTLIAYEASARDGSQAHVAKVPVKFVKRSTTAQKVYFVPEPMTDTDCSIVKASPITIPSSIRPVEAALRALLAIDSSDGPAGLTTVIPDRTRLISLNVNNGTATAVFDAGLERDGGGSCRVTAIRAQIEKTLLQFPSIKKVIISVQGKTPEETLQP